MTTDKPIFIPFLDNGNGAVVDSFFATKTISFWLAGALQIREEQRGSRGVCP